MRRPVEGRVLRALAAAAAALALLAGCTAAPAELPTQTSTPVWTPVPSTGSGASDDAALQRYYTQVLVWSDCGGGFQCATAQAPLDWSHPAEGSPVSLALIRKPAKGDRLGSLFVNPGGPGASGVDFVRSSVGAASERLQQRFDVVGWDPRGIGSSSAIRCYDDAGLDRLIYGITPGVRGSAPWIADLERTQTALGQSCLQNSGQLLGHVDTASTAHDLDMLRSDVGDARLNYLGFSYGTMIGAIYADLFPQNVGRVTLDGVVDPASSYDEITELQAVGFEQNLRAYAQWCLTQDKSCPFRGTVDDVMNSIASLIAQVDAKPIRNSDGRLLGATTLQTAIITPLYSTANWPALDVLFKSVEAGSAKTAFVLADEYNDRDSKGHYTSNLAVAFQAVDCLDYTFDRDPDHMRAEAARLAQLAPVMGPYFGYSETTCSGWPFQPTRDPGPVTAPGAAPILVVGTTNDPATPYQEAVNLSKELASAHLLTYDGSGHTAYGRSNACISDAVDDYFIDGTVPPAGRRC